MSFLLFLASPPLAGESGPIPDPPGNGEALITDPSTMNGFEFVTTDLVEGYLTQFIMVAARRVGTSSFSDLVLNFNGNPTSLLTTSAGVGDNQVWLGLFASNNLSGSSTGTFSVSTEGAQGGIAIIKVFNAEPGTAATTYVSDVQSGPEYYVEPSNYGWSSFFALATENPASFPFSSANVSGVNWSSRIPAVAGVHDGLSAFFGTEAIGISPQAATGSVPAVGYIIGGTTAQGA